MNGRPENPIMANTLSIAIRDAIRRGEFAVGALYSAQEISERFNVSRTPVREALLKLADAGVVRMEKNRGVRIIGSSELDVAEVYTIRLLLEPPAASRAAVLAEASGRRRIFAALGRMEEAAGTQSTDEFFDLDIEFHDLILRASGNRRLADYVEELRHIISLQDRRTVPLVRGTDQVLAEHRQIAQAISEGDSIEAERTMRAHLLNTAELLLGPSATDKGSLWQDWSPPSPASTRRASPASPRAQKV